MTTKQLLCLYAHFFLPRSIVFIPLFRKFIASSRIYVYLRKTICAHVETTKVCSSTIFLFCCNSASNVMLMTVLSSICVAKPLDYIAHFGVGYISKYGFAMFTVHLHIIIFFCLVADKKWPTRERKIE